MRVDPAFMPDGRPWPRRHGKRGPNGPFCPATWNDDSRACRRYPGEGTVHAGLGYCKAHSSRATEEFWSEAMDVARELNVTPWEALLKGVRLAAGRVAWVDAQLERAVRDATTGENDGGTADTIAVSRWMTESRKERALMARTAAAAVNAGVAERMVRQVELEGQIVAEVIGRVIDKLGLEPERRVAAFEEAHRQLLVLEAPSGAPTEVQGTWNPIRDDDNGQGGPGRERGSE